MAINALAVAGRLGAASDALAALGALIRIETEGLDADPEVMPPSEVRHRKPLVQLAVVVVFPRA